MSKSIIAETLLNFNKIAILELTQGNYEKALEFFKKSYFIENEMNFLKEKAKTLMNIANTEMLLNEPAKAIEVCSEALMVFEKTRCVEEYMKALLLLGTIYFFLKNTEQAKKVFLQVIQKSNSDEMKGEAYYNLHPIYMEDKNNYKAQDSITKSIQYLERSKKTEKMKVALLRRADFFKGLNRADLAAMDLHRIESLDNGMEL